MRDATARGGQNSTDIQSKIPSEFVVLAEAFNTAIKSANRTWLIAASLSIVAIGAAADDGNGVFYYSRFSDVNFFASLALALSVVNLDLCAAHSNMYEAQAVYHRYLKDIGASAKLASTSVTLKDVAHRCPIPDVCIDERRLPLFIARATLRELIAGLEVRATGEAAR